MAAPYYPPEIPRDVGPVVDPRPSWETNPQQNPQNPFPYAPAIPSTFGGGGRLFPWEMPPTFVGPNNFGGTPTTPGGAPSPLPPYLDLINQWNIGQHQAANLSRIPGAAGLEAQSSADIAALLNPPAFFPDTDRRAAEFGAARGIPGSPSAYGTGVRLTDEERLRRMALGQQMLTSAYGRNPAAPPIDPTQFLITPWQQEQLNMARLGVIAGYRNRLGTGRGLGGGSGGFRPAATGPGTDTGTFFPDFFGGGAGAGAGAGRGTGGYSLGSVDTGGYTPDWMFEPEPMTLGGGGGNDYFDPNWDFGGDSGDFLPDLEPVPYVDYTPIDQNPWEAPDFYE